MMSFHVYATHDSPSREFSFIFRFFRLLYCDAGRIAVFTFTGRVVEFIPTSAVPIFEFDWRGTVLNNIVAAYLSLNSSALVLLLRPCLWVLVSWLIHQNNPDLISIMKSSAAGTTCPKWWLYCFVNSARVLYCAISEWFGAINDDWPVVNSRFTSGASARGFLGSENVRSCDIHSSLVEDAHILSTHQQVDADFRFVSTRLCKSASLYLWFLRRLQLLCCCASPMCVKIFVRKVVESNEGKRVNGRHWKHIFMKQLLCVLRLLLVGFAFYSTLFVSRTALSCHKKGSLFGGRPKVFLRNASSDVSGAGWLTAVRISTSPPHKENMRATRNDSQISNRGE